MFRNFFAIAALAALSPALPCVAAGPSSAAAASTASSSSTAVAGGGEVRTVLIGYSGALSGVSETFGKSVANAAEMALSDANRQNIRIAGQRVFFRLLRQDDRNDIGTAEKVAATLIHSGVVGVIGTTNSGTAQQAARLYGEAGISMITPAASAAYLSRLGQRGFFRMIGDDDQASALLADYAVGRMHLRRIAVVDNGSVFGVALAHRFAQDVQTAGAVLSARESISLSSDMGELVARLKASQAEAVFFGGNSAQGVQMAQWLYREGSGMRLLISSTGAAGAHFLIAARAAANGVVALEAGLPPARLPGWKKFEEDYTQRFDLNLHGLTAFSYDAAQVLIAAIRQANTLDPKKISETLHEISYKGLTGTVAFDANGNPRHPVFTIYEARSSKWVPVKIYTEP
jgi:branched-chain amino acid transport system substrate-binding protein